MLGMHTLMRPKLLQAWYGSCQVFSVEQQFLGC
jgi:hypothetical protein